MDEPNTTFEPRDITSRKPIRYTIDPPTLIQLASQQIAVMNYRYKSKDHCTREKWIASDFSNINHELRIQDVVGFDKKILCKIIDTDTISNVHESIDDWMSCAIDYIYFDSNRKTDVFNCVEDLVFDFAGWVCFKRTAKNLVVGDKLCIVEKYRLASINCLVDDVKKLWPLVSNDFRVNNYINEPMINYWILLMEGESGKDYFTVEIRHRIFNGNQWAAIEYVFDRLTEDEQVEAALQIIHNFPQNYTTNYSNMFLKLNNNAELFHKVMKKISFRDIFFDLESWWEKYIPYTWNDMKCVINGRHFVDVIYLFLFERRGTWDYAFSFVFDMWTSAPIHLKLYVIDNVEIVEHIFKKLYFQFYKRKSTVSVMLSLDMRFFLALLIDLNFKLRNSMWRKYWTILIVSSDHECLDRMMKICFRYEDDVIRFKESEMMDFRNIEYFCYRLIGTGFIEALANYLNFCSPNVDRVRALKREIIMSSRIQSAFLKGKIHQNSLKAFDEFIDSSFTTEDEAKNYKKGLIMPFEELHTRGVREG